MQGSRSLERILERREFSSIETIYDDKGTKENKMDKKVQSLMKHMAEMSQAI